MSFSVVSGFVNALRRKYIKKTQKQACLFYPKYWILILKCAIWKCIEERTYEYYFFKWNNLAFILKANTQKFTVLWCAASHYLKGSGIQYCHLQMLV